jgi:alpha-mannosidase
MASGYPQLNIHPVGKKVQSIYENRLRLFLAEGEYKNINLPSFYNYESVSNTTNVKLDVYSVPDLKRPLFKDVIPVAKWRSTEKGESFGPSWSTHWFRIQVKIPDHWNKAKEPILFKWDLGNEGLIFLENGEAVVGLSGEERREWDLPAEWRDGQWHQFYIETSCNGMFGNADPNNNIQPPDDNRYFDLVSADLVWPNVNARSLHIDFWVIADAAREFPQDSWQKHKAREVANRIIDAFDPSNADESILKGREIAKEFIGVNVDSHKVYDSKLPTFVEALGNCHIDTAWLWPYAETRRKIGRSWSTQLDLLKKYPEYRFVASQAQQFKWLLEDYPDIFEKVKAAIKQGSFIPIGGSWVENDTNMPTGEAIVRQFLAGQRFFEAHLGQRSRTFWLPDTFGYSAQIPQLCRGAGMDRFLTQKLSWNNINNFPNTTFNWVALDGSQVICHMPPDDTYTALANLGDVNKSLKNHKNLDVTQSGMLLFGFGDGGGGPTKEMLEKLRRCRGLSDTVGELPRVHLGNTVDKFYDDIEKKTDGGKKLVSWNGELYFEFHRGTYTSQSETKKGNRRSEIVLHDLEFISTLASLNNSSYKYPKKDIDDLWEDVLLNQFHDVLPGSSIEMVYDDAKAIYLNVFKRSERLVHEALAALNIGAIAQSPESELISVNTMPWGRTELVEVKDLETLKGLDFAQSHKDSNLVLMTVPESGVAKPVAQASKNKVHKVTVKKIKEGVIEINNGRLIATITGSLLTSLYDSKYKREVLTGPGNKLVLFDDQPLNWQAWDTELYSLDTSQDLGGEDVEQIIIKDGPLRGEIEVTQKISEKSSITTRISLDAYVEPLEGDSSEADATFVQFSSEIHWYEDCKFLKVEFPVDVYADTASYETQFGIVKRPTHYNTSWDVAKFEVCAHKWADLSDYTYGVSLLNDCKYGHSIHGNVMRLSLIRAPKAPDAHADMGVHSFRYALMPHKGPVSHHTVRAAYNFNHPLDAFYVPRGNDGVEASTLAPEKVLHTFGLVGDEGLVLSNIKRFEDDKDVSRGDLPVRFDGQSAIIRVYDSLGGKARGFITSKRPIARAFKTNLLEDDLEAVDVLTSDEDDIYRIPVEVRAFEVATYRLELL